MLSPQLMTTLTLLLGFLPLSLSQPGMGPPGLGGVMQNCRGDVQAICGGTWDPQAAIKCLQDAYDCVQEANPECESLGHLSEKCYGALATVNIDDVADEVNGNTGGNAGCFSDVRRLCPPDQRQDFDKMTECLKHHYTDLSPTCRASIDARTSNIAGNIPSHFLQTENKTLTQAIIAVSILVLLVPLLSSLYAFHHARRLFNQMHQVSTISAAKQRNKVPPSHPLHLSCSALTYTVASKTILHNITCTFSPGTLTAIMGPSGSGKTTLLNLISGHTTVGTASGTRYLNRVPTPPALYAAAMRRQAYLTQEDDLLFPTLTVWETLCFAALLRLPENIDATAKFDRAGAVMKEVGLSEAKDSPVGGADLKGISGGQKRRLSIAIELLRSPASLICDEPTSGLDATTSLQLIKSLATLATAHNRTVVTTIHQPRAEIFEMFDHVVLLGKGGHLIYAGKAGEAAGYIDQNVSHISLADYDNPADFVIDAMGLNAPSPLPLSEGPEDGRMKRLMRKMKDKTTGRRNEEYSPVGDEGGGDDGDEGEELTRYAIDDDEDGSSEQAPEPAPCSTTGLAAKYKQSRFCKQQEDAIFGSDFNNPLSEAPPLNQPLSLKKQVIYLFARRFMRLNDDPPKTIKQWLSMTAIGGIISYAFSYSSNTLGKPYQTFMLLLSVSSVAMIMEYLILVPEYYGERRILKSERKRGVVRNLPYVVAVALTEVPRAVLHSTLMIFVAYAFHDLNPDPINITFCVVCLMCGCVSWQSVICLVCCAVDEEKYAYDSLFMVLGGGTLFGGLLVKLEDIPGIFKPIYYLSVTAVTQRALVVNDFLCCYLTATCGVNDLANSSSVAPDLFGGEGLEDLGGMCPPELVFKGDGTDEGNLGRVALKVFGLDGVDPFVELLTIFFVTVIARVGAVWLLKVVEKREEKLRWAGKEERGGRGGNRGESVAMNSVDIDVAEDAEEGGMQMQEMGAGRLPAVAEL